jgi:hypothetical protein
MEQIRLHFVDAQGAAQVLPVELPVVEYVPPKNSDTPIYDQLVDEFWPPIYTDF